MLKFKSDKFSLTIEENVLNIFKSFIQDEKKKNESGGILMGEVYDNLNFKITKASVPNAYDKSSRNSFERDKNVAQAIINYEFVNSEGHCIYLGEWHTHPEPYPSPSQQDIKMIQAQYFDNHINEPLIFLVIQGTIDLYIGVCDGKELTKIL